MLGGPPEAVDGSASALAQIDFVEIRLQNFGLAEPGLKADRHDRLIELAGQRLSGIQKQVLDQLLGDRATALDDVAGAQVSQQRAQHGARIDAVVVPELAILHGLNAGDQQGRKIGDRHQRAIAVVLRQQAAQFGRRQPQQLDRSSVRIGEPLHLSGAEADREGAGRFGPVGEPAVGKRDGETVAGALVAPRQQRL